MFKKLTSLISSAAILMSLFTAIPVMAEDQPAEQSTEALAETETFTPTKKQELLLALGVISLNSYGTFDNDAEMTRADFAAICGKILDINQTMTADCMYFTDVTPDSWFAYTVNQLTERGVISEADDKLFHPERSVSLTEAVKMLACLMGFNTYAQMNGGYPDGYMRVASEQHLLDGVGSGDVFTQGMMCELVYNALHANVMKTDYSSGDATMTVDYNETMLSYYKDIYEGRGMIEAVYGMSLTSRMPGEGSVIIDGTNFYTGDLGNAEDYFGYNVSVYYNVDDNNEYTLMYMEPFQTNTVTVYSDDIESFGGLGGNLKYYEGSRDRSLRIESDAVVIKNGSVVDRGIESAFNVNNGEIKFIDNDNDGSYEIALIYDFQTIVINNYNQATGVIVDKTNPQRMIDLDDVMYITILSESGERLDTSALTQNSVIDAAVSEDHILIYVNSASVSGEIESLGAENEVTIDGTIYKYMSDAYNRYRFAIGDSGLFKLNKYNKIAFFDPSGIPGNPGFLIRVDYANEIHDALMVKMLDAQGNISWIDLSNNVKIDGDRHSFNDTLSTLEYFEDSAVIYRLNKDNQISSIDTSELGDKETDVSLQKTMSLNSDGHRWMNNNKMFDRNVIVDTSAVVFKVPPKSSEDRDDSTYSVAELSDFVSNRVYQVEAYKTGSSAYSTILVWYENKYYQNSREAMIIVEKVTEAVNAGGEEIYNIEGWQNGSEVNVELEYPHDIVPKRGDCIRVGRDKNNVAGLVEIHYDYERNGSGATDAESDWHWNDVNGEPYDAINNYWNGTFNDLQGDFRLGFGYVVGVEDSLVKISYTQGSDTVNEIIPTGGDVPIIVYDAEKDKFREGSIGDLMSMESYGSNCSTIVANFSWGDLTELYVINNRYKEYGD